jgi:hypothetical protein
MKTATLMFMLLALTALTARSEVFKCQLASGDTVYQEKPCLLTQDKEIIKQNVLAIEKTDPTKEAERQQRLAEWEKGYQSRQEAERKAEQERLNELERLARIEALNRNAIANQELADAVKDSAGRPSIIHNYAPFGYRPYRYQPYHPFQPPVYRPEPPAKEPHYLPLLPK